TGLHLFPEGKGWLIVELGGDSVDEATAKATALKKTMEVRCAAAIVADKGQQKQIWLIREAGLGATAFIPGHPDTWPGWEDSAVSPERVGAYLRDLRVCTQSGS